MLGWFAINPVTMTVSLKESKQKSLAELCHNISSKHKVAICEIEKIVETISSDLIAVPLGGYIQSPWEMYHKDSQGKLR